MTRDNQKRAAVARMNTKALERIASSLPDWQRSAPSPEAPMAGRVHITGIGQVPVAWIDAEIETRKATQ